jgi:hypothetical protein
MDFSDYSFKWNGSLGLEAKEKRESIRLSKVALHVSEFYYP